MNRGVSMKLVKRITLLLVVLCFMITACKKTGEIESSLKSDNASETGAFSGESVSSFVCYWNAHNIVFSSDYCLYHNDHGRLQIFDTNSKKDLIYCFDVGCEHKQTKRSMTGEVLEQGCIAYEISAKSVLMKDDKLYFLNYSGELCVSDRQGANRRVIGHLPDYMNYENISDLFYSGDKMFAIYYLPYELIEIKDNDGSSHWISGEKKEKDVRGMFSMDLSDGKYTEFFNAENYGSYLCQYDVRGDHVYFAYWYCDIPYMGITGDTFGLVIPEELIELSVEEYRDEMHKRTWLDIFDYNYKTGELNTCIKHMNIPEGNIVFCRDFFALSYDKIAKTVLYRYNGESFNELDYSIYSSAWSDEHLFCSKRESNVQASSIYMLVDEANGETIRTTSEPIPNTIMPIVVFGESVYCYMSLTGDWCKGYIPLEDFWNGDISNAVQLNCS